MGVYIDMEMPRTCYDCKFRKRNGLELVCPVLEKSYKIADTQVLFVREKDCPLIEVPEPHGDLIDREELQHIIGQFSLNWEYGQGVSDCWDALLNAPTVIPASEEG